MSFLDDSYVTYAPCPFFFAPPIIERREHIHLTTPLLPLRRIFLARSSCMDLSVRHFSFWLFSVGCCLCMTNT
jgi:hypothetical protein